MSPLAHLTINVDRATLELAVILQPLPSLVLGAEASTATTCLGLAFKSQCFHSVWAGPFVFIFFGTAFALQHWGLQLEGLSWPCRVGILVRSLENAAAFVAIASLICVPAALTSKTCKESSRKTNNYFAPTAHIRLLLLCLFLWLTVKFPCSRGWPWTLEC